jgi:antitoxin component YwqK of YwqJK toxin-antitoxin module
MKSILLVILFLFIPKLAVSQLSVNDKLIYLDSTETEIYNDNYKYYRIIKDSKLKQKNYILHDYYKSGAVRMKGTTSNGEKLIKEGMFVYYYENGNKKTICSFDKNDVVGKRFNFYENGNKKEEGEHIWDKKNKIYRYIVQQHWDSIGTQKVFDGNGELENTGQKTFSTGKIKNGFRDGVWTGYDKDIGYTFTETYENQKLVSGVSIDKDKVSHNYTVIEVPPRAKNFYNYIANNYKTPNIPSGIKGTIYVTFMIETDGEIANIKILKDLGYETGVEAIRVLKSYGNWMPGEQRGIKVRYTYSLPIAIQSPN